MEIKDLLAPEAILPSLRAHTKKHLIHDISARAAQLTGLPDRRIFETLLERERLGSTGMGQGISIPHGRFSALSRIVGIFARLEAPIPYESVDGQPVDLVFALLTPENAGADHLKALARVSRLLRNHTTCGKLRAVVKPDVLYALLTEPSNSQGAQAA